MFYVGLLITAADVLIALALANFGAKSAAKTAALEQSGVLALAQITGMGETGTRINDQPVVKLQLHIEGPGIAPFDSPGPRHRQRDAAGQPHQPQTGGAGGPGHPAVPNRLGTKRFDQRPGARDVHGRRGQQDLRPQRPDRCADGDPADPQGQRHRHEQHDRSAVQSCCAPTGAGSCPAGSAQQAPAGSAPPPPAHRRATFTTARGDICTTATPEPSASQRLQELETLRATGAVSEEEYTAKRQQIISDL